MSNEPSIQSGPLASLRLRAGLSQTELAAKLNTSQPNIARFEKSPGNATLESIKGWASVLGVPVLDVIAAIESTNAVGEKSCE
jgi:transcriptional regulator with XRE-family HTH domain